MGLFLFGGMLVGCVLGLTVTVVLGAIGLLVAIRIAKARTRAWWCFAVALAVLLPLCLVAVHEYPYAVVRPGSDYDVAMKNLFLQGFGYCASPGVVTLLAALVAMAAPKKATGTKPGSNASLQTTASRGDAGEHG